MDISLSQAVAIARKWESEETKVNAYMQIASPPDRANGTELHCSGLKLEKKRSARGDSSALGSVEIKATS